MGLPVGTKLGPYEVVGELGSGGMGVVYEARDARLERSVALKVLPAELAGDSERRRRFTQEAQLASSLQHAGIVTVFDVGAEGGLHYLAMELVHGQTLAHAIPKNGLRLNKALDYAVQIADALAAAHAAGVVHRDLKPGNIMVTEQGRIKILDFGLATLSKHGPTSPGDETRTEADVVQTREGTVLGTVAYMSPEQAEGRRVDERTDLFSLGAILYEMLSGHRAFRGDSPAATLAAVINLEPPPLAASVPGVPPELDRLIARCLRKDLSRRAQHASDIKLALEELLEDSTSGALRPAVAEVHRPRRWAALVGFGAGIALLVIAVSLWPRYEPPPEVIDPVPLTALPGSEAQPTFSPDGLQVAFAWTPDPDAQGANSDIYVQVIGAAGVPLRLTDDDASHSWPAWSPDGTAIAFWHRATNGGSVGLHLASPLGGPERQVLELEGLLATVTRRIAWSPDGHWLAFSHAFGRSNPDEGVVLVSPASGDRIEWVDIDPIFAGSRDPSFSSDGARVAFARSFDEHTSEVFTVPVGPDGRPAGAVTRLPYDLSAASMPVWTADGRELLIIEGSPTSNGRVTRAQLDGSAPPRRVGGLGHATSIALSRDGARLAFSRGGTDLDIWRLDLEDPAGSNAIAHSTLFEGGAEYSPDGTRIAFSSNRGGSREIWVASADGENAMPLTSFGGPIAGTPRWSPDGRAIVFDARPAGNSDIFVVPSNGGAPRQLTDTPGDDGRPAWSPDGQWIYFSSDRGGSSEIWRMPAGGGAAMQVTRNGGHAVVPSLDGTWLYYNPLTSPAGLYRIRPDGTGAERIGDDAVPLLSFGVSPAGLWFAAGPRTERPYWSLRRRDDDGSVHDVTRLDFAPGYNLNISISRDGRHVLLTKPDVRGADLWLVDGFR